MLMCFSEGLFFNEHLYLYFRARLPLANSDDFAKAYSCPLGSTMNPKHKCAVW